MNSTTTAPESNTKQLLLQAAKRLFAAKGFDGTTVKEISDEAGVNVSLVSYYFDSKEGLYRACLCEFGHSRLEAAQRMLLPANSLEECRIRLQMFIDEMTFWMIQNPECCQIVQRETDQGLPIAEDVFLKTFLNVFKTLKKFLSDSQDKKFLRPEADMQIIAGLMLSGIAQLVRNDRIGERFFGNTLKDEKYRRAVKDQFMLLFFEGLVNRGE